MSNEGRGTYGTGAGQRALWWRLVPAIALLVGGAALWWWQASQQLPSELRVGYAVEAPYAFVTPEGRVTGEGPEIARIIAERAGLGPIVWRQMEFGSLVQELENGQIDMIAAGLFVTPERSKRVDFAQPTFVVASALLVAGGNPLQLHSYADVIAHQGRVAVLAGSVEATALQQEAGGIPLQMIEVPDAAAGLLAVAAGQADAFALSAPSLRWAITQTGLAGVELAEPFTPPAVFAGGSSGSFAFHQDADELREIWNSELSVFVGSPAHVALVREFGFTEADLPAAQLVISGGMDL